MNIVAAPRAHSIHCLNVLLESRMLMASQCIWLLEYDLQVPLFMDSQCISKFSWSWVPSVCPTLFNSGLQLCTIIASKWISKHGESWPPVNRETCSITASTCISVFTSLSSSGAPWIALMHHLQPIQSYCVLMGSYIHIHIHGYLAENKHWIHEFW